MRKQSTEFRFYPVAVEGGYRVCDGATGQHYPHVFRFWTSANYDALRRERGNNTPFKPNLQKIQAKLKVA